MAFAPWRATRSMLLIAGLTISPAVLFSQGVTTSALSGLVSATEGAPPTSALLWPSMCPAAPSTGQ